jgi:hypothetical protein
MNCTHCKGGIDNRLVVMEDDDIHCYTCGRLKAEMSSRRINLVDKTKQALRERKNKHA